MNNQKIEKRPIKNVFIYVLKDPLTNEIRYVGKTARTLQRRLSYHLMSKTKDHRGCWIQSLMQQKLKPIIEEIEKCTNENWQEREIFWIKHYKDLNFRLTNSNEGGLGSHNPSPETCAKIAEAKRGKKRKPFSDETKLNMSKAHKNPSDEFRSSVSSFHKGRKRSIETRTKISNYAKNRSEQHLANISAAKIGSKHSAESRAKMSESAKRRHKSAQLNLENTFQLEI